MLCLLKGDQSCTLLHLVIAMVYSTRSNKGRNSAVEEVQVFLEKGAAEKVLAAAAAAGAAKGKPIARISASTEASSNARVLRISHAPTYISTIVLSPSMACALWCFLYTVPSAHVVVMHATL